MTTVVIYRSELEALSDIKIGHEPITSGSILTPYQRVYLEYDLPTSIETVTSLTPFNILIFEDIYTPAREKLDCAILSKYFELPVDNAERSETDSGIKIQFFLQGAEPLWTYPMGNEFYTSLISMTSGMKLVSTDPFNTVSLELSPTPQVLKHPYLDIWYTQDS